MGPFSGTMQLPPDLASGMGPPLLGLCGRFWGVWVLGIGGGGGGYRVYRALALTSLASSFCFFARLLKQTQEMRS